MTASDAVLDPRAWLVLAAPVVGSFLGLVVDRWPRGEPFLWGRSHCPHCRHTLGALDLVPLVSWAALRQRCRYCSRPISAWYPSVEVAALMSALWAALAIPASLAWVTVLFGWALLTLALIDLKVFWLPSALTVPLGIAGLAAMAFYLEEGPIDQLIGAVIGYAAMRGVAWLYRRFRGREGLGTGDATLLAALGAWVGWLGLSTILLYAGIGGLIVLMASSFGGRPITLTRRLAFGPYLCLGGWLVWLYGPLQFDW